MTTKTGDRVIATVERDAVADALSVIASVVKSSDTVPILTHVLLRSDGNRLTLVGSDLNIQVSIVVPVQCHSAFAFTVHAHRFGEIARACSKGAQIQIEVEEPKITVKSGRSRWTLHALPAADFPNMAADEMAHGFTCQARTLAGVLKRVKPFEVGGADAQLKYYLAGTFLHAIEGKANFVATNGHGMGRVATEIEIGEAPDIIISSNTTGLICKVCEDSTEDVEVTYSPSKIALTLGQMHIFCKLIDGTYPDYSRVIPTANDKCAVVDAGMARDAIRRVTLIATDKVRAAKFDCEKGKITLSVSSPEFGAASDELPCEYDSEPLTIGFNARYFTDMLASVASENVTIHLADASAPTLFRETPEGNFTGVLMPMRV